MKNMKIAILTMYYESANYGGNLQAYALCKAIGKYTRHNAKQICYLWANGIRPLIKHQAKTNVARKILRCIKHSHHFINFLLVRIKKDKFNKIFKERKVALKNFNKSLIPHSNVVYSIKDITDSLPYYDAFITGSDQVWNTNSYIPDFFLNFVPSDKIKISYAASISKDSLTDKEKEVFKRSLADFKAVSVREEQAVELIKDLSPVSPVVTLDPTLLLDEIDWDNVCAPRVVQDDYIFCYFLGNNTNERKIAKKFAKEKGLKLVSVPLTGAKVYSDLKFGDVILPAASPEEFISLIKHASYVFTDSFHAVVFSQIYKRQYFVFNRDSKGSMNSRIINITNLFNTQERFCNGKDRETLKYVQSLNYIDFTHPNKEFEVLKEFSINFLKENLS